MMGCWILFVLYSGSLQATSHALKVQSQARTLAQTTAPSSVPGFQTDTPAETILADVDRLQQARPSDPQTAWMKKSAEKRPYFRVDPLKDPLFENTRKIVDTPQKFLKKGQYTSTRTQGSHRRQCRESRPNTLYTCTKTLLEPTIHLQPAKYSHYWCTSGMHRPDDARCRAKRYYNPARKYQDEVVTVTHEKWTSTCQALEEQVKKGLCRVVRTVCPKGPETRDIVVSVGNDGKPVTRAIKRNCWRYEVHYRCSFPSENSCERLRQAKCSQVGSKCLKTISGVCVEWEQTFKCPGSAHPLTLQHRFKPVRLKAPTPGPKTADNQELGQGISQLAVLNKLQGEIQAAGGSTLPVQIFKGSVKRCTIAFANFKNCCAGEKGWGTDLNLSGCSGEDQQTNQKVSERKCVELGTYCAEKVLGICLRKKRTYCCFDTKLARLLHEQGRRFGWGDAEHPQCRGFTIQELAALNFDTINFSEAFEDVLSSLTLPQLQTVNRTLSERLTQMTAPFRQKGTD